MKKKESNAEFTVKVNDSIRRDWGMVKPFTRVEEDKRKKKPKYKGKDECYE